MRVQSQAFVMIRCSASRTVPSKPKRHRCAALRSETEFPMSRDGWLFALSIAWLCMLLYAAIFVLFVH